MLQPLALEIAGAQRQTRQPGQRLVDAVARRRCRRGRSSRRASLRFSVRDDAVDHLDRQRRLGRQRRGFPDQHRIARDSSSRRASSGSAGSIAAGPLAIAAAGRRSAASNCRSLASIAAAGDGFARNARPARRRAARRRRRSGCGTGCRARRARSGGRIPDSAHSPACRRRRSTRRGCAARPSSRRTGRGPAPRARPASGRRRRHGR